ncbi:hypothetical protein BC834DRAFT_971583 [Gloeopeniophorella convolvens]|nr:hypothetical protein BC834DRAFT_971583 [Gloeopeniophorella convolvens]
MSHDQSKSQYAAAAHAPLIQSPSLRVPRATELPPDIHPLPESVTPYFVYPFTLEPHVLALSASRRSARAAHAARQSAVLAARADAAQRRARAALRRVAPGFEPHGAPLVPVRQQEAMAEGEGEREQEQEKRDVMGELVDGLARLDAGSGAL